MEVIICTCFFTAFSLPKLLQCVSKWKNPTYLYLYHIPNSFLTFDMHHVLYPIFAVPTIVTYVLFCFPTYWWFSTLIHKYVTFCFKYKIASCCITYFLCLIFTFISATCGLLVSVSNLKFIFRKWELENECWKILKGIT